MLPCVPRCLLRDFLHGNAGGTVGHAFDQLLSAHSFGTLKKRTPEGDEFQKMGAAVTDIANSHNIFIDDSSGLTITDVRSRARRLSREVKQLGLIVVDYIQLMSGDGRGREPRSGNFPIFPVG